MNEHDEPRDLQHAAAIDILRRRKDPLQDSPGPIHRPAGKETHYGSAEYVDPFDVNADWNERA